jgi:hypothetical protein
MDGLGDDPAGRVQGVCGEDKPASEVVARIAGNAVERTDPSPEELEHRRIGGKGRSARATISKHITARRRCWREQFHR